MAILFAPPFYRATDLDNAPISGAFISFYKTATSTPQPIYADDDLTIPLTNPIQSDGNGVFPAIWMDDSLPPYKYVIAQPDVDNPLIPGAVIRTGDPYNVAVSAAQLALLLNPRTQAEISTGIVPTNFAYREGDIRRYGALTTASNNAPAWDAARTVSASSGNAVLIPPGRWNITVSNAIAGDWSVYGMGQSSILAPQNCDGVSFGANASVGGARFLRDFVIDGTNCASRNGISVNFPDRSGRVSGCQFDNLSIYHFGQAVFCRGLWQSTFQDVFIFDCYQGYYFHGENIVIHIIGGFVQHVTAGTTGVGTSYGVLADSVSGETTQSLHLENAACYNFDVNVSLYLVLYSTITECDLSINHQIGVEINGCRGGMFIRNNWIQTNDAGVATVGVSVVAQGTPVEDRVVIDGNWIGCTLANAGSKGIAVGGGNTGVVVTNNSVGTAFSTWEFAVGISNAAGAHNMVIANNTIAATGNAIVLGSLSQNVQVHDNNVTAGNPIIWDTGTPVGLSYRARGTFTGTITGVTATVTGTVSWIADGRHVEISIPTAGITGTSNTNALTLTGMPFPLWPVTDQTAMANVVDNGGGAYGTALISAGTGVITLRKDASGAVFTTSGTKGINGTVIRWPYL